MQPIYVDPGDEITTVIERMKESSNPELTLIIPKGAILLQSIVNLKLAKKTAAGVGKELSIVTTDKIGRNLASQVGISVLSRVGAKPEEMSDESSDESKIIDGAKIHRYYDDEEEATNISDDEAEVPEPIIPRATLKTPKEEKVDESPIVIPEPIIQPKNEQKVVEIVTPTQKGLSVATATILTPTARSWRKPLILSGYLATLLLLGATGVSAFYLPKTEVNLFLPAEPWSEQVIVEAAKGKAVEPTLITEEASETITVPTTGTKEVGETASGTAQVFNNFSSDPQTVPAGATISVNGLNFVTKTAVSVPGATVQNGAPVPGSVIVGITATQPGSSYNLQEKPGTVPGNNLYVQLKNTSGGSTKEIKVLSQTDVANAREQLVATLEKKTRDQIMSKVPEKSITQPETDTYEFANFEIDYKVGSEIDSFTAKASATRKRLVLNSEKVMSEANKALDKIHESSERTYSTKDVNISKTSFNLTDQTTRTTLEAKGFSTVIVPLDSIKDQLPGKKTAEAANLIKLVTPEARVEIDQSPNWWPIKNLPYSDRYLTVTIHEDSNTDSGN